MTQKLIMCRWLPASGKSTWAKEYVKSTKNSVRINNDDLREMMHSSIFSKENEQYITTIRELLVSKCLDDNQTVIVDNTNLNPIHEEMLRSLAEYADVKFEIKEFAVDIDTCIARDRLRWDKSVWEKVIRDMARQFNYYPEPPREFDKVVQSFGKDAFIFDIDGTLAYMQGRSPYDYTRVSEDGCHKDIAYMAEVLKSFGHDIIICSWRKDDCREETMSWLYTNNIPFDLLLMRKSDDNRKDSIVKYELLLNEIIPHYYVKWVFDDRKQVVDMWRQSGLRCYQVADGNF